MPPPDTTNPNEDVQAALALAEAQLRLLELDGEGGQPQPGAALPPTSDGSPVLSLSERAEDVIGLDPDVTRLNLLPYPKGALEEGSEIDWTDWVAPQIVADMAKSAILPGHVAKGGDYTTEDVVKFTLDYALPAAQRRFKTKQESDASLLERAPTTEELRAKGGQLLTKAKESGARLKDDDVIDLMIKLEGTAEKQAIDPQLHKYSTAALRYALKRLESGGDMENLMLARRNLGTAARKVHPDDRDDARIAGRLIEVLDDFVMKGLSDPKVAAKAQKGRAIWGRMRRSEMIDDIVAEAQLSASGLDKGLQQGFRSLLKSTKRMRGFNDQDKALMRRIAKGGPVKQLMDWIGKFSFSGSTLRGGVGAGVGYAVGGPAGAVAVPVIAQGARTAASAATSRRAELARALAATGGRTGTVVASPSVGPPLAGVVLAPTPEQRQQFMQDYLRQRRYSGRQG